MSPIMQSDIWNTDETRTAHQYILTAKEREFILTGETSSYTEDKLNRQINQKAGRLTERIQDLLDDFSLLYMGGYVGESKEKPDLNASKLVFRTQSVRDQGVERSEHQTAQPASNLGFEIGSLLQMINLDTNPERIVWNFILGLVGRPAEEFDQELEQIQKILDELETQHERRLFHAGADVVFEEEDGVQEQYKITRDVLRDENITPVESLITTIVQHHLNSNSSTLNLGESSPTERQKDRFPVSNVSPEQPTNTMGSEEWDEASVRMAVQTLLAETTLRDVENLCADLKSDTHQINTRKQFGTQAEEVFRCFPIDTRIERANFPAGSYSSTEMLSAVLHKLSPQEEHPLWTTRPVVEELVEAEWKLTPYGRLLYKTMFDYGGTTSWVYQFVVERGSLTEREIELIENVIDV